MLYQIESSLFQNDAFIFDENLNAYDIVLRLNGDGLCHVSSLSSLCQSVYYTCLKNVAVQL